MRKYANMGTQNERVDFLICEMPKTQPSKLLVAGDAPLLAQAIDSVGMPELGSIPCSSVGIGTPII
jgi:hypothetical protein